MARPLLPLLGADPNRPRTVSLVGRYALGLGWEDGHQSIYSFASLRGACPCGACAPADDAWPTEVRRAAAALHLVWQDGHESTLPYPELRRQCPCAQCATTRRRSEA